jgi:hypothetical protein
MRPPFCDRVDGRIFQEAVDSEALVVNAEGSPLRP